MTYLLTNFVWKCYTTPWLELELAAAGKMNDGDLSLKTCRALSRFNFGRVHHQGDPQLEGSMHYGQALKELATRLSDAGFRLEILIVPMLLMLLHVVSDIPINWTHTNTRREHCRRQSGCNNTYTRIGQALAGLWTSRFFNRAIAQCPRIVSSDHRHHAFDLASEYIPFIQELEDRAVAH